MKKIVSLLLILIFSHILPTGQVFGQGEGAIPTLTLQQSPLYIGAGQIGAAIATDDPLGFYYNPAVLGYTARKDHLSFLFMPEETQWFISPITYNTYGLNLGYTFKKSESALPLSVGFGFLRNVFDYGNYRSYGINGDITEVESKDSFNSFSFGADFEYYALFNVGLSIKTYNSKIPDYRINTASELEESGTAFDFGAMIITPISQLFFDNSKLYSGKNFFIKPAVNFTLGYAMENVGKKVYYIDPAQTDPLLRTARFGYTFDFGLNLFLNDDASSAKETKLNIVDYSFTAEAEDVLIKPYPEGGFEYQNFFGDIKLWKNLVELKGDENVYIHRGHIFRFFETLILTTGRVTRQNYLFNKSNGLGISSDGVFKILSMNLDDSVINFILDHFELSYYSTSILIDPNNEIDFKGVVISLKNIEF
jgi:hypothetical protein